MSKTYTNIDAQRLVALADEMTEASTNQGHYYPTRELCDRLRIIADHLQSLDEKIVALQSRTYEDGWAAAMTSIYKRSNILPNPSDEDSIGQNIMSQIDMLAAQGRVRRIPMGERALDDQPHRFNAPVRKRPAKLAPDIALDLSGLDEV